MPKISILGTATPPTYCDCILPSPVPHYHWAVFVDPTSDTTTADKPRQSFLSSLNCFNSSTNLEEDFSSAAVFDLHGHRLRNRPAIQVSFTSAELPVQLIVAKPGAPANKVWSKRDKLVEVAEKALKDVSSADAVGQDEWADEALLKLIEAGLLERFNQDAFRKWARNQVGKPTMDRGKDSELVREVDYVEVLREKGEMRGEGEFQRVQVGGGR